MIEKIEDQRINELTEAIVLGHLKRNRQNPKKIICVDLDGIAKEYFGFNIRYEAIAEEDLDANTEYDTENTLFGEYSFKIEGDLNDDDKALYHTEYLNTTDVSEYALSLSGWGKADSLPISGPDAPQGFELFAYYIYYVRSADGNVEMRTVSTAIPFNWQVDDWQYVSKNLNLPEVSEGETITNVYSVTFGVLYKGNLNTAYFDNVELAHIDAN